MLKVFTVFAFILISMPLFSDSIFEIYEKGGAKIEGKTLTVKCKKLTSMDGLGKIKGIKEVTEIKIEASDIKGIKKNCLAAAISLKKAEILFQEIETDSCVVFMNYPDIELSLCCTKPIRW